MFRSFSAVSSPSLSRRKSEIPETAKATDEVGMRATLGYGMIDLFDDEKRKQAIEIELIGSI